MSTQFYGDLALPVLLVDFEENLEVSENSTWKITKNYD